MTRTQLNIKIPEELLEKLKDQARSKGYSVTQLLIDLVKMSLSIDSISESPQLASIDKRLKIVESILYELTESSQKNTPFTESEAINLSLYIKTVFDKTIKSKGFINKKQAWSDFVSSNSVTDHISQIALFRLKEILLMDDPDLWTKDELNEPSCIVEYLDFILTSLFNWAGIMKPPSKHIICRQGVSLL